MLYRDSTVYTLINSSFLQILSSGLNTLSPDKTQNLTVIVIGVSSTVRALDLVLCVVCSIPVEHNLTISL